MGFKVQKKRLPTWHDTYSYTTDSVDIDTLVITNTNSAYTHGPAKFNLGTSSQDFSRYLAYDNGIHPYLYGFKYKTSSGTSTVPLIYKGCGVYSETDGFKVIQGVDGPNSVWRDILYIWREPGKGIKMTETAFNTDNWGKKYSFWYPKVLGDGLLILDHGPKGLMQSSSYAKTTWLYEGTNPPYQIYFEVCGAGGGSGGSSGYDSSGGGGGGAAISGILDFTQCSYFQIGLGSSGDWGLSAATEKDTTNGSEGGYSYIVGRGSTYNESYWEESDSTYYDAKAFDFYGVVLGGGTGGGRALADEAATAGSGGQAFVWGGHSVSYKKSDTVTMYKVDPADDDTNGRYLAADGSGYIGMGVWLLDYAPGAAGGRVDNPGGSVSALSRTLAQGVTVSSSGGSGGSASWGGGGGASALGNGGQGARTGDSYQGPGPGGGAGGKGLYWLGAGQHGDGGGSGYARFCMSGQSNTSSVLTPPTFTACIEQDIDPTTGKLNGYYTVYAVISNYNVQGGVAHLTWKQGTAANYSSYSKDLEVGSYSTLSWSVIHRLANYYGYPSDGFVVSCTFTASDGQSCDLGSVTLQSSIWSPPASTASS